jgi:excinuclease UvrABC ATPase subunit
VVRTRKGEFVDLFDKLNTQGYSRVRVDGVVHPLTDPPKLKKQEKHDIEVVVDRLTVKASAKQRLTDSVETALNLADGIVVLDFVDREDDHPHREQRFSENWPAPTATRWPSTTSNRGRSRSTRRTAPARNAAAWASARRSTPNWWCPTRT